MKITIIQTITNIFYEDRTPKSSYTTEQYVLEAEEGNILKNIKTNQLSWSSVCVNSKNRIAEYIEVKDSDKL